MNRWALFVVGLVASIGITVVLWSLGLPGFFLFLLFPFLFLAKPGLHGPARDHEVLTCPLCDKTGRSPDDRFCPRDGSRLQPR